MSGIEPIRKRIVVAASQERAFAVFTSGIDRWWPRQHHIGSSPLERAVLEPRADGRWYSICADGSECDIGKVLAWQITADWKYDAAFLTEIEVRFIAEGDKRTRVELEHRNLERYGEKAAELRKTIDSSGGWGGILEAFGVVAADD